jgi:hypothetical protein
VKKTRSDVWLICENLECPHNANINHAFLVSHHKARIRKFCCNSCAAKVRSNTPEAKIIAGNTLRVANKLRHLLYPQWDKNNKEVNRLRMHQRNVTPEMREISSRVLTEANKNRKEKYPQWDKNCRDAVKRKFEDPAYMESHKLRWQQTLKKLHQDPEFISRRDARASNTFIKLNQDPAFIEIRNTRSRRIMQQLHKDPVFIKKQAEAAKITGHNNIIKYNKSAQGRQTSSKTMREKAIVLNNDPAFASRRNKRASSLIIKLNADPTFRKKRDAAVRLSILRSIESGSFGKAQKVLFNFLLTLDATLCNTLCMEKIIYLSEEIVRKYEGSNKSYYRVDIAYLVNDQVKIAIEVDGEMGHSTEEDLIRDSIRDTIMLNEFGIKTLRVANIDVFRDTAQVAAQVLDFIKTAGTT